MQIEIINPDRVILESEADWVVVPGSELGIDDDGAVLRGDQRPVAGVFEFFHSHS